MTSDYIPAALTVLVGVGFALLLTAAAKYLGPGRASKAKDYPYECGSDVIGSPRTRFEIKFYQVAILFLVFDIETAFLYPWALRFRELSCVGPLDGGVCTAGVSFFGLGEILVFMGILIVALTYVWRKRAVGWE
ncbi:MAG: NADH-quinone oxidoreductase subunit A [Deltaproteobacteria bacterium]|nr:NADH-quinone oxidoreductase subunit A [Deltaproteobacteria bacterium]